MLVAFVKRGSPHLCTEVYTGIEEWCVQKPKVRWNSGGGSPISKYGKATSEGNCYIIHASVDKHQRGNWQE